MRAASIEARAATATTTAGAPVRFTARHGGDARTDWPAVLPAILDAAEADALLDSETRSRSGSEVRYRARGSLAIDLDRAVWTDHESGCGGGVLALVAHLLGSDERAALDWLRDRGLIGRADKPVSERAAPKRPETPGAAGAAAEPGSGRRQDAHDPANTIRVRRLLKRSRPLAFPARDPVGQWRAGLLAESSPVPLRWIEAADLQRTDRVFAAPDAAGAIVAPLAPVAAWAQFDARTIEHGDRRAVANLPADVCGVQLLFVGLEGEPVTDAGGLAKRTYAVGRGVLRGCGWATARPGRTLHLAEGIADALAVAAAGAPCLSALGTSGLLPLVAEWAGPVVLHADGDAAGLTSARAASRAGVVRLRWSPDPAAERERLIEAGGWPDEARAALRSVQSPRPRRPIRPPNTNKTGPSPAVSAVARGDRRERPAVATSDYLPSTPCIQCAAFEDGLIPFCRHHGGGVRD